MTRHNPYAEEMTPEELERRKAIEREARAKIDAARRSPDAGHGRIRELKLDRRRNGQNF